MYEAVQSLILSGFAQSGQWANVDQLAVLRCSAVGSYSYAYSGGLGCPLDQRLQGSNGRHDVIPSYPQAPRQHGISRIRQVANSCLRLLVFDVDGEQLRRARYVSDRCRDL
jgi:hypothetical protein